MQTTSNVLTQLSLSCIHKLVILFTSPTCSAQVSNITNQGCFLLNWDVLSIPCFCSLFRSVFIVVMVGSHHRHSVHNTRQVVRLTLGCHRHNDIRRTGNTYITQLLRRQESLIVPLVLIITLFYFSSLTNDSLRSIITNPFYSPNIQDIFWFIDLVLRLLNW